MLALVCLGCRLLQQLQVELLDSFAKLLDLPMSFVNVEFPLDEQVLRTQQLVCLRIEHDSQFLLEMR